MHFLMDLILVAIGQLSTQGYTLTKKKPNVLRTSPPQNYKTDKALKKLFILGYRFVYFE